jgi:hypothetical protein
MPAILNFFWALTRIIYSYVTTISFLKLPTYYKLKTHRSLMSKLRKNESQFHLMCELPATVNIYRIERSLSVADPHFFPNTSLCSLLNFCITKREKYEGALRYLMKKEAADLSRIGLT